MVAAAAVVIAVDVGVAVVDAIADCSCVDGDFVVDDHVGLENLNFDNFLYSAKQIEIRSKL